MLELCKNRAKKSKPVMLNQYANIGALDMITNAGMATRCRQKIKAPWFQTKYKKMKDISKTWVLTDKHFERFQKTNRTKTLFSTFRKTPVGQQDPKAINWISPL